MDQQAKKKQLETALWNIADELRGNMDASEFKNYILGFIFYKYLSENLLNTANKLLKDGGSEYTYYDLGKMGKEGVKSEILSELKEDLVDALGYFLPPSELFQSVVNKGNSKDSDNFILGELGTTLSDIERSTIGTDSEDDFSGLFSDIDLTSPKLGLTEKEKNEKIVAILTNLAEIDFDLENTEFDIIGDAYEYMISQFAADAGKKAGEFYTPQGVSTILSKIVTVGKTSLRSAYDPTGGSGSLLLNVAKNLKDGVGKFYGQELNTTTFNLMRMNMILHKVHFSRFNIQNGDTLTNPKHLDERFDAIVANPPFSLKWKPDNLMLSDPRFSVYGKLAPKDKADYAFVTHMLYHLDDNGTMAVVLPLGVLFRGGAEGHIRQHIIEKDNYLDAVIVLPDNLFYGTGIPACIMVFKKCRKDDDNLLFIDASQEFDKQKNQNFLTTDNINKIVETYKNRTEIDKYSRAISLNIIKDNEYNLNISRYIDNSESEKVIDIHGVSFDIKELAKNDIEVNKKISAFCKELNIPSPF